MFKWLFKKKGEDGIISPPVQNIVKVLKEGRFEHLFLTDVQYGIWIGRVYLQNSQGLKVECLSDFPPIVETFGRIPGHRFRPTKSELKVLLQAFQAAKSIYKEEEVKKERQGVEDMLSKHLEES